MQIGVSKTRIKIRMANSDDPDESAECGPSHQDLHCLHRYCLWSAGLKGLKTCIRMSDVGCQYLICPNYTKFAKHQKFEALFGKLFLTVL